MLVEGESDAQTLWHRGYPAIGLPGANQWREGSARRPAPLAHRRGLAQGPDIPAAERELKCAFGRFDSSWISQPLQDLGAGRVREEPEGARRRAHHPHARPADVAGQHGEVVAVGR